MQNLKDTFVEEQTKKLKLGLITRRSFVANLVAAGVVLPTALTMATDVLAAKPKKGGKYRAAMSHGSTTDSLDPATYENDFSIAGGFTYGNYLTEVNKYGELVGELAESMESDDAQTWVFNLRKGVEFHNGKTLDADDVIASFNHHRGDDSKSAAKGLVDPIKDIKKDGKNTVVFSLESPSADFPYIVSDYHIPIMQDSGNGKIDATSGVGTGPYTMDFYEPGVRFGGKRNPNYWKENAAWFDEVEFLAILDSTAKQSALLNGDVDVISGIAPKTVSLMSRNPNIRILEVTGTRHYTFPMRLDVKPFDNYDLRMALKLAIKRQELVDKILLNHGSLGNDYPLSSANRFVAKNIKQREFDADKAKHHYKKSGHSGTLQLSAADAAFSGAVDAAQLISASAKEVGIDVEVVREPKDGYWSNVWNKKGWCACYWSGRPTADWMFASAYVDSTEWNDTAWKTTPAAVKFNKLVKQARAELDQNKRQAQYEEAQQLLHDDGGAIVPMFANYIDGISNKIAHDENVAANWDLDGNRSQERWWFA